VIGILTRPRGCSTTGRPVSKSGAARARQLAARLGALTARARSADGLVSVTVGSSGAITGLELKEGIRDRLADETARAILATVRAAQASLTAAVTAAAAETVGADSETGKAVIASYVSRQNSPEAVQDSPEA
jgi:hypothetical protein